MPVVTVQSGPYAGMIANDLSSILLKQHNRQAHCKHSLMDRVFQSGVTGFEKQICWRRIVCDHCGATIWNDRIRMKDIPIGGKK